MEHGLYAEQVGRFLEEFGENDWIGHHEDFKQRPHEIYRDLCRFPGVDTNFVPDMGERHLKAEVPRLSLIGWTKRSGLWEKAAKLTPQSVRPLARLMLTRSPSPMKIDPADRQYLVDYYREDGIQLGRLLNQAARVD